MRKVSFVMGVLNLGASFALLVAAFNHISAPPAAAVYAFGALLFFSWADREFRDWRKP